MYHIITPDEQKKRDEGLALGIETLKIVAEDYHSQGNEQISDTILSMARIIESDEIVIRALIEEVEWYCNDMISQQKQDKILFLTGTAVSLIFGIIVGVTVFGY